MKPLLLVLAVLCAVPFNSTRAAAKPDIFAENVRTTEPLTPEEERAKFHLPDGFKIQLVAAEPDLRKPMNMAFDSVGRLWVTESREYPFAATNDATARDTIRIFSDFDANGRAGKVTTFATNLNIPIGLYPFRSPASNSPKTGEPKLTWKCVVWSIPNIWLLEDTDGDGVADKKEKLYGPFDTTRDTHGNQASFRRGADGWIYATHGFNNQSRVAGRDGHEIFLPSGNIYRFKLDGSRIEHWTHGQVNPFGLCFDPLGNLYSADCHSSPIYQLLRGACYPSFGRPHDGLGFGPTTIQHSHGSTAIAGIVYLSDPAWPAEYQNNIFIGNVMTSRINRDQITFTGSTSKGTELPDFLRTDDPWFRPVDLQFGPDGALWVADFYNRIIGHYEVPLVHPGRDRERGRIWRILPPISPRDSRPKLGILPNKAEAAATNAMSNILLTELVNPNTTRSRLALEELLTHQPVVSNENVVAATKVIFRVAEQRDGAEQNGLWLWLLERQGQLSDSLLLDMLKEINQNIRVHALRILNERGLVGSARVSRAAAGVAPAAPDRAKSEAASVQPNDPLLRPPGSRRDAENDPRDAGATPALLAAARAALADPSAFVQRAAADALAANPHPDNLAPLLALQARVPADDPHLAHVVRMALREQVRLPDAFAKLADAKLSEADARVFATVAVSVTNAEAASFLLRHVQTHAEPAEALARYVTHAARYAPDAELGTVATLAKKQFSADLDTQAALFKSLQDGLATRGGALPPSLHTWGADLAAQLLAAAPPTATWTYRPLDADKPGRNPFAFEERNCADGQKARLMSSFPHGETLTGVLRSPVFVLPKQLSFYLCGHDGVPPQPAGGKNSVRLLNAETKALLREAKVPRNDTARKVTWDLTEFAGQRAMIEVKDGDDGKAYAWLAFGRFEPALPELALQDTGSVAKRQQAGADLARFLLLEHQPAVVASVQRLFEESEEPAVRAAAGRAWLALDPPHATGPVGEVVRNIGAPESVRAELAIQLGQLGLNREVVVALTNAPTRLQLRLATALVATAAGTEQLLTAAEAGRVPARILQDRTLADRLGASSARDAQARWAALTKNLPPADAAVQQVIDARRKSFDAKQASAARGADVFTKACAVCHQLEGKGALVGPQLDGVGGRGLERLLEDILDPNRNVDKAFRTTVFVLNDGESVSGLFRREEGATLVYALANGQEARVAKAAVKERRETETSLMPANFAEALPAAELNDLLAFLLAQRGK